MNPIIKKLPKMNKYMEYIAQVKNSDFPIVLSGLTDTQKIHMAYSTLFYTDMPICIIANNELVAHKYMEDLKSMQIEDAYFLPKREVLAYDYEMESRENSIERVVVFSKLLQGKVKVLITTIESISQPIIQKDIILNNILSIKINDIVDVSKLSDILINCGYEKTSMVEVKGQFSVRGSIIDIYPANLEYAVRIDLW